MKRLAIFLAVFAAIAGDLAYAQRFPMPYAKMQLFDRNGKPCSGCRLWSYVAGTTTPTPTYQSASGAANTNPVLADSAGRMNVWLSGAVSYKLILEDATCQYQDQWGTCHGATIWTVDSITDYGANISAGGSLFAGDVTGAYDTTVVEKIQGVAVSTDTPSEGDLLVYTTSGWTPSGIDLTESVSGILPSSNGGTGNGFAKFSGASGTEKTYTLPNASTTILTANDLVTSAQGGTGNGFTKFTGPTTAEKTFTLPDANATILTSNAVVTAAQGGTGIAYFKVAGPTAERTYTFPDVNSTIPRVLTGSDTIDFAETPAGTSATSPITVTGAAVGDPVALGIPSGSPANTAFTAHVTATDTVTVTFHNYSAGAVNPDSGTYKVTVIK